MKIVFKYTSGNVLSLYSLSDFYQSANRICENQFGVTAPEGSAEIRTPDLGNTPTCLHILIELTGSQESMIDKARGKWIDIGKGYGWELLGTLKEEADIPDPIDSVLLLEDWA